MAQRQYCISRFIENNKDIKINGDLTNRLPGNINVSFKGCDSSDILMKLDEVGICASDGSACSSGTATPSHVLRAIGLDKEWLEGTIRITLGFENTKEDIDYLIKALDKGCDGYILKDSDFDTLKKAIMTVYKGETYIEPSLVPLLNVRLAERDIMKDRTNELTRREIEVLRMIAAGSSNKEIASVLNISERTVKNHISNIFKKIDVSDRTQAAVFAIKNDIITLK